MALSIRVTLFAESLVVGGIGIELCLHLSWSLEHVNRLPKINFSELMLNFSTMPHCTFDTLV